MWPWALALAALVLLNVGLGLWAAQLQQELRRQEAELRSLS